MKRNMLKRVLIVLMCLLMVPMTAFLSACDNGPTEPAEPWTIRGIWSPVSYNIIYNSTDMPISSELARNRFNEEKDKLRFIFDDVRVKLVSLSGYTGSFSFSFNSIQDGDNIEYKLGEDGSEYEIKEEANEKKIEVATAEGDPAVKITIINDSTIRWEKEVFGTGSKIVYTFQRIANNINAELGSWEYVTSKIYNPHNDTVKVENDNLGIVRFNFDRKTVTINNDNRSYSKFGDLITFTYEPSNGTSIEYAAKFVNGKLEISRAIGGTAARYINIYQYAK